jgi:hypothetical protein
MIEPGVYRHFKGNEYKVVGTATHTETGEEFVVYYALYGEQKMWIRPVAMFTENIDRGGYKGPRFLRLNT